MPQNTLSLLKTNRRFVEAYLLGLNDSMSSEALWRGAPVWLWTTFFRQFWDVRGLLDPDADPEPWKDIDPLTEWKDSTELGRHQPCSADAKRVAKKQTDATNVPKERAVLLVRGDLLKRYPNTLIYAVESLNHKPALDEHAPGIQEERVWPIFSGTLAPDLTFLGFPKTAEELSIGGSNKEGYFIVLEERLGQPRFGFDLESLRRTARPRSDQVNWWYDLTWDSFVRKSDGHPVKVNTYIDDAVPTVPQSTKDGPLWGASSASVANICLQRPIRVAIHASKMLPKETTAK